ncbi:MAG: hypothetical protein JO337_05935, partial [Acidimicrobiales bacterium]|nr:hypothetical protein [Acidimicrobiales bacterium]
MREVTAPRARRGDLDHAPRVGGRGPRRRVAAVVGLVLLAGAGTWIGVSSGSGPGSTSADRAGHPCSGPLGPAELCPLTGLSPPQSVLAPAADSYFSASSPFNQALPATTQAVAGTEWAARALASQPTADIYKYGVPIFSDVTDQTPRYHVTCTKRWGECPLSAQPVPVPPDAEPSSGSDAAMVIVDREAGLSYEFWQTRRSGNAWVASWGAVVSLSGLGNGGDFGPGG